MHINLLYELTIGNHCLAIFKEPESYTSMQECLKDIREEAESLTSITIDGVTFEIEYYLGGDWKFLAMATGIDSATSTYACIWCKCPTNERANTTKKWSITDTSKGARTIEENVQLGGRSTAKFNVSHIPLFPKIPLTRVVVDNLHMFLRVSDVLIDLFIVELRALDRINQVTKLKSMEHLAHLLRFEKSVKDLGVSGYSFWIGRESRKLKWRSFTGPEKLKVLSKINLVELFPEVENVEEIQALWREFIKVNESLSVRPENMQSNHAEAFEEKARTFVRSFNDLYATKHVTPYMHCMMNHVAEFMKLHGSILPFTQQGLEKYNDTMTKDYFRATSHKGEQCLIQILQKQNRMEYLEARGTKRAKKHNITCSNCKCDGHNRLTCIAPCSVCDAPNYCAHLGSNKLPPCDSHVLQQLVTHEP